MFCMKKARDAWCVRALMGLNQVLMKRGRLRGAFLETRVQAGLLEIDLFEKLTSGSDVLGCGGVGLPRQPERVPRRMVHVSHEQAVLAEWVSFAVRVEVTVVMVEPDIDSHCDEDLVEVRVAVHAVHRAEAVGGCADLVSGVAFAAINEGKADVFGQPL